MISNNRENEERNQKVLDAIRESTRNKSDVDKELEAFINILTPSEKETFATLTMDKDKENFYNKVMISRAGALKDKLNMVSIDSKIAKDIMDVTPTNLKNYLIDLKSDKLEEELETGIAAIKREYTAKASRLFVERRNKLDRNGKLDILLTLEELDHIKLFVESELMKNPAYKFSLLVINNTSGTITVFNDKIVESRRDYEITKLAYCNEKGMTPESFDMWQEYVKRSHNEALLESENGFSNLPKFNKEWHVEAFKRFYKRDPKFKTDEVVYKSSFLEALDTYDNETLSKSTNQVTSQILKDFDEGMVKYNAANRSKEDIELEMAVGPVSRSIPKKDPKMLSAIEARKEKLKEKTKIQEIKEPVAEIKKSKISDLYNKQDREDTMKEILPDIKHMNINEEAVYDKVEEESYETEETAIVEEVIDKIEIVEEPEDNSVIHEVVNPDSKLKVFRNKEVEENVLIKYSRKPDLSLLKTINNPKLRVAAYKNSAVVNGFRIYLPYSGFEVVIKKIQDKSRLSYIFSMIADTWDSQDDIDTFIEEETLKIIFDNIEFPNFQDEITFKRFVQCLSEGDIPILMVAFAMTNIPENKDGRVLLDFTSLRCTECKELLPINPISLDLKDLFSKIYPLNEFKKSASKASQFEDIDSAYRSTKNGEIHMLESNDDDGICKFRVYYSRPTIYKNSTVSNKEAEANFNIVKDDMIERDSIYKELHGIEGIGEYISNMTHSDYLDRTATLATYITMLAGSASDVTDDQIAVMKVYLEENMSQLNIISKVLQNSGVKMQPILNICRYLDAVLVVTNDGEEIITEIESCQDDLYDTIAVLSTMPKALIDRLSKETMELGSTYKFEHENVYYTYNEIKGNITKEFLDRYSPSRTVEYTNFLKNENKNITDDEIEEHVAIRDGSYKNLLKGKCSCGNESFFINYIVIVFFSTFKG